ncbi:MAG: 3'(2'),5'-bisphosphate nucleotidase CysQ [Myxococcales bacterium]|nr:3'(2'),5'-bisphosphate nucleotidase CysQ [Myxococcales bacterium]
MLETELEFATEIARDAGKILLEIYATDFGFELKGKADPVTEADQRANEFLVKKLRERFPEDGIVAEETADQSDATRFERCWYVDPLDGTKEFIAKNGEFSVMVGLAIGGEAKLGVVFQPVRDKLYRGVVGHGATLHERGEWRALEVSEEANPAKLALVASRSHRPADLDELIRRLGITKEAASGSVGLKIGIIAERQADLYVHASDRSSKWDACAPEAILRAAGGRFTDVGGAPFRYDEADIKNRRGILACNATAYEKVFPVIHALATERGFLPK